MKHDMKPKQHEWFVAVLKRDFISMQCFGVVVFHSSSLDVLDMSVSGKVRDRDGDNVMKWLNTVGYVCVQCSCVVNSLY